MILMHLLWLVSSINLSASNCRTCWGFVLNFSLKFLLSSGYFGFDSVLCGSLHICMSMCSSSWETFHTLHLEDLFFVSIYKSWHQQKLCILFKKKWSTNSWFFSLSLLLILKYIKHFKSFSPFFKTEVGVTLFLQEHIFPSFLAFQVYSHFDMKHETASLLESRSGQCIRQWFMRRDKYWQTEDLLEAMRYLIEAAEVYSTIDAGHKTDRACARASLLSLQVRIPDIQWIDLSETNARRVLVEQSRFPEALIIAEAYNLNQSGEWALVLWNQMLKPDLVEQFVAEFVAVLPLQSSMLLELARFYRAEVAARGDQSHFSVWLSPGGLPAEWVKHLGRSFRSLLRRTRDLRVRMQLATVATGFLDVVDSCMKLLDKVPENAGPLILRKGHGGAYLPLM